MANNNYSGQLDPFHMQSYGHGMPTPITYPNQNVNSSVPQPPPQNMFFPPMNFSVPPPTFPQMNVSESLIEKSLIDKKKMLKLLISRLGNLIGTASATAAAATTITTITATIIIDSTTSTDSSAYSSITVTTQFSTYITKCTKSRIESNSK